MTRLPERLAALEDVKDGQVEARLGQAVYVPSEPPRHPRRQCREHNHVVIAVVATAQLVLDRPDRGFIADEDLVKQDSHFGEGRACLLAAATCDVLTFAALPGGKVLDARRGDQQDEACVRLIIADLPDAPHEPPLGGGLVRHDQIALHAVTSPPVARASALRSSWNASAPDS